MPTTVSSEQQYKVANDCYVVVPVFNLDRAKHIEREVIEIEPAREVVRETKTFRNRGETKWIERFYTRGYRLIKNSCINAGFGLVVSGERKQHIEGLVEGMLEEIRQRNLSVCSVRLQVFYFHIVSENTAAVNDVIQNVVGLRDRLSRHLEINFGQLETAKASDNAFTREKLLKEIDTQTAKDLSASLMVGKDVIVNSHFRVQATSLREQALRLHAEVKEQLDLDKKGGRFKNLDSMI